MKIKANRKNKPLETETNLAKLLTLLKKLEAKNETKICV